MLPQRITPAVFGDTRLPARFWAKVDPNGPIPAHCPDLGPCWEWTGARGSKGYGHFLIGSRRDGSRRPVLAHRLAYETLIGPIPKGLESDHLCHNGSGCPGGHDCLHRTCANPAHIEPVSHAENVRRGITGGPRGETNGNAKLTETQVREIRSLRGRVSQSKLAARFGVSQTNISCIQRGKSWGMVACKRAPGQTPKEGA